MLGFPLLKFGASLTLISWLQHALRASASDMTVIDVSKSCIHSLFLPFLYSFNPAKTPRLRFKIGTSMEILDVQMDTGSTGFLLDPDFIDSYDPSTAPSLGYEAGYQYLSSSHRLYIGYWVPLDITLLGSGTDEAVSHVKVLALDRIITCLGYRIGRDNSECPTGGNDELVNGTKYMGVGFGRQANGQPQGTPDKNVLLNIQSINGVSVASRICQGYSISAARENGIYVGIDTLRESGFQITPLGPGLNHTQDHRDWAAVPMAVSVNGSPYVAGSALIDTGIEQMYLRAGVHLPSSSVVDPNDSSKHIDVVSLGTIISIAILDDTTCVIGYSFRVGHGCQSWKPAYVIPEGPSAITFANTGRHLLGSYDVSFNAQKGTFGLKDVRDSDCIERPPLPPTAC